MTSLQFAILITCSVFAVIANWRIGFLLDRIERLEAWRMTEAAKHPFNDGRLPGYAYKERME